MIRWQNSQHAFRAPMLGSAAFEAFCRMFFSCYSPLTVEGRNHLPDEPFLLCSNHSSHADSAALMTASGLSFRRFALLGARDYFFHSRRVHMSVSALLHVIPIDRQPGPKSLSACITTCRQFLEQSRGILILYPEGTRSPDGEMRGLKSGAGLFASELGVPVVPAFITGTFEVLPKGRYFPRPVPVTVRFGQALQFSSPSSSEQSQREKRRLVVEKLAQSIRNLSPVRQPHGRGEYETIHGL
jgi:1-acyl-sn-glycerol-3-phosphate acyltransferase